MKRHFLADSERERGDVFVLNWGHGKKSRSVGRSQERDGAPLTGAPIWSSCLLPLASEASGLPYGHPICLGMPEQFHSRVKKDALLAIENANKRIKGVKVRTEK